MKRKHQPGAGDSVHRAVVGGLRSTINDHGPITKDKITSAAKRVIGNLKNARPAAIPRIQDWAPATCRSVWDTWHKQDERELGLNRAWLDRVAQLLSDDRMREVWLRFGNVVAQEEFFRAAAFACQGVPDARRARLHGALERDVIDRARALRELLPALAVARGQSGNVVAELGLTLRRFEMVMKATHREVLGANPDPFALPRKKRDRAATNPRIYFVKYMTAWARAHLGRPERKTVAIAACVLFSCAMSEKQVKKIAP